MALNSIIQSPMTTGILDTLSAPRVAGKAAVRREAVQWPWPLPANSVLAVFDHPGAAFGAAVLVRSPAGHTDAIADIVAKRGARLVRRTGRWLSAWEAHGA